MHVSSLHPPSMRGHASVVAPHPASSAQTPSLVVEIIPPYQTNVQQQVHLATAMHGLVLDAAHPVALEITGTQQRRRFLLRATTQEALAHAVTQVRARLPQADIRPLETDHDPFTLHTGEGVSALELRMTAPYLPLRVSDPLVASREGADPLLGILAAFDDLPADLRAIAQIALLPAPPTWARRYQRRAIESALEPERLRERWELAASRGGAEGVPSTGLLIGLGIILASLLVIQRLPGWVQMALGQLVSGHLPTLSLGEQFLFFGGLLVTLVLLVVLVLGVIWVRRRFQTPLYDSALVRQKIAQAAYRSRLRLYVIGPEAAPVQPFPSHATIRQFMQVRITLHDLWTRVALARDALRQGQLRPWLEARRRHARVAQQLRAVRKRRLARLVAAYRQYDVAAGNSFLSHPLSEAAATRCLLPATGQGAGRTGWWQGLAHSTHFLGVEEVALLWHVPAASVLAELAQVERRSLRTLPLPPALVPAAQQHPVIGTAEHAGHRQSVALPPESLMQHLLVAGKSGEGKSTLLSYVALEAMRQGGLVLIDPHGDLADHVLGLVPAHRKEEVVFIDLSDPDFAVGINGIDVGQGRGRDKAISDLLKVLSRIWARSWGSRMEIAFAYALRTLFEANRHLVAHDPLTGPHKQYTLLDVMPLLTDESFCHSILQHVDDPFIVRWWHLYYDPLNVYMQRDRSDPVLSKIAHFESQIARRIVGQSASTINLAQCIQREAIVLIKLAKGLVGEDVAGLLGSTLLGLIQLALEEQANVTSSARKRLPLIIDEFQVLSGVDWAALAELRKYGASFVLATQSLDTLREMEQGNLLSTVLAAVKQYAIFHLSAKDAVTIHQEIGVEPEDILSLESHQCYLRLSAQSVHQPTFSASLHRPPVGDAHLAQEIRLASRTRYARPGAIIEEELKEGIIRALAATQPTQGQPPLATGPASASSPSPQASMTTASGGRGPATPGQRASGVPAVQAGLARQNGGYRGRKAQQKSAGTPPDPARPARPMNWSETVGATGKQASGGEEQAHGSTETTPSPTSQKENAVQGEQA